MDLNLKGPKGDVGHPGHPLFAGIVIGSGPYFQPFSLINFPFQCYAHIRFLTK